MQQKMHFMTTQMKLNANDAADLHVRFFFPESKGNEKKN